MKPVYLSPNTDVARFFDYFFAGHPQVDSSFSASCVVCGRNDESRFSNSHEVIVVGVFEESVMFCTIELPEGRRKHYVNILHHPAAMSFIRCVLRAPDEFEASL